jgi:5'-3' exonuclease
MGIKQLGQLLKKHLDKNTWEYIPLEQFRGHRIVIDVLNQFHPTVVVAYGIHNQNQPNIIPAHRDVVKTALTLLFHRIESLVGHGIIPVMIMDGKGTSDSLKHDTQDNRRSITDRYASEMVDAEIRMTKIDKHISVLKNLISEGDKSQDHELELLHYTSERTELTKRITTTLKASTRISDDDREQIRLLSSYMGTPYIVAEGEAEKLCSQLVREGHARAALSNDTDLLAHGCPVIISMLERGKGKYTVNVGRVLILENVLSQLKLSYMQFVDLCVMCGTDYNPNVPNFGVARCKALIDRYGSLDNMPDEADTTFISARSRLGPYRKALLYNQKQNKDYKAIRREFLHKRQNIDPTELEVCESDLVRAAKILDDTVVMTRYIKDHSDLISTSYIKLPFDIKVVCGDQY